jgi:S-DNA-T family DNA segregation ATPase FtsK/SpoIIIE
MFTENSEVHLKFFNHPLPSKPVNFNMKYLEKGREGKIILPIIMGMSRAGFEIFDLAGAPSALIGGESGGGKTTLFRVIIANLVHRSNCELYVVDVTRKLAYMKAQGWFEAELEGIDDMLGYLYQEMYDRYKAFEDIGVDEISGLSEEEQLEFPRIVLLIDEFNGLSPSMVKGDTPERAIRNNIVNKIAHLITKGRGCGIHLVVGLQRPDARLMEDGQIKANMSVRIAFRTTDASNSKIILDNSMAAAIPADIPGRCVLRGKDRIRQVQVFNLDYQTAKKLLPKEPKNVRKSYIPPNPLEFLIK